MPNVGDIIRASDVAVPPGIVVPFYNVTLSGRYPIFWGKSEVDTGWLVCDGGSDLHGGNVPNLTNKFIMGTNTVSGAKKTGGSTTTSSTSTRGTVGATTLSASNYGSHRHYSFANIEIRSGSRVTNGNYPVASFNCDNNSEYLIAGTSTTSSVGLSSTVTTSSASNSHTHSFTGSSHTHTLTPPYYTLIFCVKLP